MTLNAFDDDGVVMILRIGMMVMMKMKTMMTLMIYLQVNYLQQFVHFGNLMKNWYLCYSYGWIHLSS